MTHKQLVERATNWIRHNKNCNVVARELRTANTEHPDVIGFYGNGGSVLVECKVSRSDFLADREKIFRHYEDAGMGDFRYFAAPVGLIKLDEVPAGWGLMEVGEHRIKILKEPDLKTSDKRCEVKVLMSIIRRLEISTAVFVQFNDLQIPVTAEA